MFDRDLEDFQLRPINDRWINWMPPSTLHIVMLVDYIRSQIQNELAFL